MPPEFDPTEITVKLTIQNRQAKVDVVPSAAALKNPKGQKEVQKHQAQK